MSGRALRNATHDAGRDLDDREEGPSASASQPVGEEPAGVAGAQAAQAGPYDADDPAAEDVAGGLDFGSLRVPMPARAQLQVEQGNGELLRAVHVLVPSGRVSLSALAAPRSSRLWRELAKEIADSLEGDGAKVWLEWGRWGREVQASSKGALSRFIGVDGPRWMLYGVATGPAEGAEELAATLRAMISGTVVTRGVAPLPVKTVLPLRLPEHLEERVERARGESARRPVVGMDPVVAVAPGEVEAAASAGSDAGEFGGPPVPYRPQGGGLPRRPPGPARPARRPGGAQPAAASVGNGAVSRSIGIRPGRPAAPLPAAQQRPPAGAQPAVAAQPPPPSGTGPAVAAQPPPAAHAQPPVPAVAPQPPTAATPQPPPGVSQQQPPAAAQPPPAAATQPSAAVARPPGHPAKAAGLAGTGRAPGAWPGGAGQRGGLPPVPGLSSADTGAVAGPGPEATWTFARPVVSAEQVARQPAWALLSDAPMFWPHPTRELPRVPEPPDRSAIDAIRHPSPGPAERPAAVSTAARPPQIAADDLERHGTVPNRAVSAARPRRPSASRASGRPPAADVPPAAGVGHRGATRVPGNGPPTRGAGTEGWPAEPSRWTASHTPAEPGQAHLRPVSAPTGRGEPSGGYPRPPRPPAGSEQRLPAGTGPLPGTDGAGHAARAERWPTGPHTAPPPSSQGPGAAGGRRADRPGRPTGGEGGASGEWPLDFPRPAQSAGRWPGDARMGGRQPRQPGRPAGGRQPATSTPLPTRAPRGAPSVGPAEDGGTRAAAPADDGEASAAARADDGETCAAGPALLDTYDPLYDALIPGRPLPVDRRGRHRRPE